MEGELNVGRDIQMSMVPLNFPALPEHDEFSIFATIKPAAEVAGDFYDFFFIDDDYLCFCVGDVSGKGVPAALFMAVTRTLVRAHATDDRSPASISTRGSPQGNAGRLDIPRSPDRSLGQAPAVQSRKAASPSPVSSAKKT